MNRPSPRALGVLASLAAALTVPLLAVGDSANTAEPANTGRLLAFFAPEEPRDGLAPEQATEIERAIAAFHPRAGYASTPKVDEPGAVPFLAFPFFPQAGILGRDLFLNNFTDQNAASGLVRDWDCSEYTYDGHQGHDSLIRSFREQAIGVPIFAVLPGTVIDTHDGEPDMNTVWDPANHANYVVLDHGGGLTTIYLHMRSGSVAVSPGQAVTAGTQLGLTGSSGFSDWPHLHLETRQDNQWIEPSAGPCRSGDSRWENQPPVFRDGYVADFFLSRGSVPIHQADDYLLDDAPRAGSFLKGHQPVGVRVDFRNLPPHAALEIRVVDPRKRETVSISSAFANSVVQHLAFVTFGFDLTLDTVGTWHFVADVEGMPHVDASFRVVANSAQLGNRKPNKIAATMTPRSPIEGRVLTCTVNTSPVTEDPDYDVVGYRYDWRVNGKLVRSVTSAAWTDLLAAGVAAPGDKVQCKVTPSDGRSNGPTATAANN